MSSVQDHAPVIKELSGKQPQDPQPSQPEQSQPTQQQVFPKATDPPVTVVTPADAPREYSPPRFSQLLDSLPEGVEPQPPRRGSDPNQSRPTTAERRSTLPVDPIRGETALQINIPLIDEGDQGRSPGTRRVTVPPRARSIYNPPHDGTRVSLRGGSGGDSYSHHQDSREPLPKTVEQRMQRTLEVAKEERDKYKKSANLQSLLINGAIGAQVLLGAITTGVAAGSKNIGSAVAVLGGMSTALASYLAKARGSGEPEFSTLRARELNTFIREVEAFIMDHGHKTGPEFDLQVRLYRERFELIIKTEGEDSTSGTGYASLTRGHPQFNGGPPMGQLVYSGGGGPGYAGGYANGVNGGGYPNGGHPGGVYITGQYQQTMPPQGNGGNGQLSEKQQMLKDEKALSGMV